MITRNITMAMMALLACFGTSCGIDASRDKNSKSDNDRRKAFSEGLIWSTVERSDTDGFEAPSPGAAAKDGSMADYVTEDTDDSSRAGESRASAPAGAGLLTAGTFDDSVNLSSFEQYWQDGSGDFQWPNFGLLTIPQRYTAPVTSTSLEVAMVIDATGSMGDELEYIKKELAWIVNTIKEAHPDVTQRFSLIVYRDVGDEYVTRGIDFTEDLAQFQEFLALQSAGGGGDYPEAMHTALEEASSKLQWSDGAVKTAFLIADAPPHGDKIGATKQAIDGLAAKGVRLYPVAASGVQDTAERVLRYGAATTGGEYIFITDDSGIGNSHAEPKVPCYHVRKLNQTMVDLIKAELSGTRHEPKPEEIIRTVGTPVNGVCQEDAAQ